MAIDFDTDVNDKVISLLTDSVETLNTGFRNNLLNDFSPFTQVNLFTTQLNNLKQALDTLVTSYESLTTSIQDNKYQWTRVVEDIDSDLNGLDDGTGTGNGDGTSGGRSYYGGNGTSGSGGGSSGYSPSSSVEIINPGVSVSTSDVSNLVTKLDDTTIIALLKKLNKLKGENSVISLLTDMSMSGILVATLKQVLGDTSEDLSTERTDETDAIQKALLEKVNVNKVDINTSEGKETLQKEILENINNSTVDESVLNEMIYGDNTKIVSMLDGNWVIAKTKYDLSAYASYIASNGVRQNIDTDKYGDYCLAFSYVHAYDLFTGITDNAAAAGAYSHAGAFEDFIDDDKSKVLAKVYDEIMRGRPVVIQVNGNKAGTSRHFVTVVGFKEGVTSAESLKETDLLIVDSWDGKIERMDTETSRFMTSGKDCGKEYSGYRLRVLKDSVA